MSRHLSGLAIALGVVAVSVQGCSSGGGDNITGNDFSITLSLGSSSGSIAQGSSSQFSVSVARGGGYAGTLSFSVAGAPPGVSGVASNVQTSTDGTTTTATITLTVGAAVATGAYPLTVQVSGNGVASATGTFTLTVTSAGTPGIILAATGVSIAPGGNGQATITVSRSNFTGTVNLTAENLPTGVTVSFTPAAVTGTSATATVTVGASVAPGAFSLTVRGAATGVPDATTTIALTVSAPAGFTLAASPATLSVAQGASGATTIAVTRTGGFGGSITFSASGLPSGVTASFNPASTTGNTTALTLTASGSATVGAAAVTVTGTSGATTAQAAVGLTITSAGGGGGGNTVTADFSSCDVSQQPIWFAAQDGSGPWTMLTGSNSVYTFTLTGSTGAYAYVTSSAGASELFVNYGSTADLTSNTIVQCPAAVTGGNTVTGTVAGVGTTDIADFGLGGASAIVSYISPSLTFQHVPDGTWDLVGYRQGFGAVSASDRGYVQRGITVSNGLSLGTVDFNGANSFAPMPATITITNPGAGEQLDATMLYLTDAACHIVPLWTAGTVPSTFTAYGFPPANQAATDYHGLFVSASTSTSLRLDAESFHSMGDRSITLPALLSGVNVTTSGAAYARAQVVVNAPTDITAPIASLSYHNVGDPHQVQVTVGASLLTGSTYTVATPEFSGVAGWNNSWAPAAGQAIEWSFDLTSTSAISGNRCAEGVTIRSSQVSGTK